MMGVLEFIPVSKPFTDPELTHLAVLNGTRRVLTKGGVLLLGIENRYWLGYWLGFKDHHTDMRLITLLPRRIADIAYRVAKGKPHYLERTYSYFELNNMLTKAGFRIVRRFTVLPSWECTKVLPDINNKKNVDESISSIHPWKPFCYGLMNISFLPKLFWKVVNALGLMKIFCSNFIYVCERRI